MAEVNIPLATTSSSNSPPPNCAICLGTCTNKCFSDSCMHQFCFTCLLEWSKVKAECPLCKQPFTSIIHNVKSNNEYDEHIVEPSVHTREDVLNDEYLYLPTTAQPSRHFQFRTTFTVDPRGELAIQQMLLTHHLTNSAYSPNYNYNYRHRHRRDATSSNFMSPTNFRRMVYVRNMWVTAPPDVTGRYRDVSPRFYRENPAAINRLVPWLNRELNALLEENTQQVMLLVDIILGHLNRHYIRGFFFKNLLREYLGSRTEHFIYELYNFMKSPYDMVGYDRRAIYYPHSSFIHTIPSDDSSNSSDSDITVVATTSAPNPNPFHRPTIEVIEINSDSSRDSDVIIHEPPPPVVVDLINTTDDDVAPAQTPQNLSRHNMETKKESTSSSESDVKPKHHLVSKKEKRSREKYEKSRKKMKKSRSKSSKYIYTSSETDSSSSSSESSSNSSRYKYYKRKRKQKTKKSNRAKHVASSDSTDDEPLSEKLRKIKEHNSRKSKKKDKMKYYKHKHSKYSSSEEYEDSNDNHKQPLTLKIQYYNPQVKTDVPSSSSEVSNHYQNNNREDDDDDDRNNDSDKPLDFSMAAFAGPSYRSTSSPKIKKERCRLWYSRPHVYESDDDDSATSEN
ncbi:peroxisome assembly protein 10 [Holotrichia oblita]|uniref:Peroxisome assembly protein 10 n=1 Tax=Holotrichia oblita TaxID=644536 RepID=A0ACB9TR65_HOLOL|nr:peroxisome assembly protein 10 [Holotrichia oblita]